MGIGLKVREMFTVGDQKRDAGNTVPEDVIRYTDIVYGTDPKWQCLDVYRPKGKDGKLPVIISYHGGGWVYGNKEVYQWYTMSLAERGFAVINYTYRLAPEFQFPAPLEDANLVVKWMLENAEKYGFDTDNVFAVGDSAGGHGIALYTCILSNPEYAAEFDFDTPKGFCFNAVGLNCGAYHIEMKEGKEAETDMTTQLMYEYLPGKGTEKEKNLIEVSEYIKHGFPPVMIMTCDDDPLTQQPHYLLAKMIAEKVPFEFRYCVGTKEPLPHVFHCNVKLKEAAEFNDEECEFFRRYLK